MGVEVINFTKATGGAPVTQDVNHNLGETPIAAIFYGINKTATGFGTSFIFSFGFYDGTNYHSVGVSDDDNVASSNSGRAQSTTKCIRFVDSSQTVIAEADVSLWDSTKVRLNWTTNDANAYHITCILFSGAHSNAQIVGWTTPASAGSKVVSGVSFQPESLIHISIGNTVIGDAVTANCILGITDSAGNEYVATLRSADAQNPSDVQNGLYQDSIHVHGAATVELAGLTSMNSNGFTMNFSSADASTRQVGTLCLKGFNLFVGTFDKSVGGAPASQGVTGVGFRPEVLLFLHACDIAFDNINTYLRNGIGAADSDSEFAVHLNSEDNVSPSNVDGLVKTDKCLVVADNHAQTIDAEADLTSLDSDGFTLDWTTNNATAYKIAYIAFALSIKPVTDTITVADSVSVIPKVIVDDTITITDTTQIFIQVLDAINFLDELEIPKLFQILDTINISDSLANIVMQLELNETITFTDEIAKTLTIQDAITLADAINQIKSEGMSEGIAIVDEVQVLKKSAATFVPSDNIIIVPRRKTTFIIDKPKKQN